MIIEQVTIAGAGMLGAQIAWQTAFNGFRVSGYDAFEKGIVAKLLDKARQDQINEIDQQRQTTHLMRRLVPCRKI
jgi:3-hydroxyacyl-CoA dehydrogenase